MGNHYIPRYYLKGFSTLDNSEQIYLYQKGSDRCVRANVTKVGQENGLYPDELEAKITEEIEQVAKPILDKITGFQFPTPEEKLIFSRYIMVMRLRVPKLRDWVHKKMGPELLKKATDKLDHQLIQHGVEHPEKITIIEKHRQDLHNLSPEKQEEIIQYSWLQNVPSGSDHQLVQVVSMMTWQFVVPEMNNQFFFTSDNPVFFFKELGIGKPTSELIFPISRNLALWATWRTDLPEGFTRVRTQFVKEVNRRTLREARKYIYSPFTDDWIHQRLNNQEKIKLNRIM